MDYEYPANKKNLLNGGMMPLLVLMGSCCLILTGRLYR